MTKKKLKSIKLQHLKESNNPPKGSLSQEPNSQKKQYILWVLYRRYVNEKTENFDSDLVFLKDRSWRTKSGLCRSGTEGSARRVRVWDFRRTELWWKVLNEWNPQRWDVLHRERKNTGHEDKTNGITNEGHHKKLSFQNMNIFTFKRNIKSSRMWLYRDKLEVCKYLL